MNLLKETTEILTAADKTFDDVRFVQTSKQIGTVFDFVKISDFDYDNRYGGNVINGSLKIVGDNWWLERGEYDGSEWWEFKTLPIKDDGNEPLITVNAS